MIQHLAQKRVVLYIRVSTQEQAKEGYSIEGQREKLISYCKARGWTIVEVIVDPGFSGANLDRPGIQRLIEHITDYDMVLVYRLDRLSRSQFDTLYLIESVFLPNGVDFVSLSESFDTSTPFGRAMIGILSVFAQLERETIKERMTMGHIERVKDGKFHGGTPPFGYDYNPETGKLVINEYEAMQVRMIYQMYIGTDETPGIGFWKIANYLQSHGYTTRFGDWKHAKKVIYALSCRTYLGEVSYGNLTVPNAHPAIITQEMFDRAQEIRLTREDRVRGATRSKSLLVGYVFCGCCGNRLANVKREGCKSRAYVCYSKLPSSQPYIQLDKPCASRIWNMEDLDAVVDYEVRSLVFDKNYLRQLIQREEAAAPAVDDHDDVIRRQMEALDKKIERLMDLYADGTLPVELLNEKIKAMYAEKEALRATLHDADPSREDQSAVLADTRSYLDDVGEIWNKADTAQKREILSVLVDRIWIYEDNTVKIDWTFT